MKIDFPYTKELLILDKIFNADGQDNLRIVGGAVRSFLMEKPLSDYDLSCRFNPEKNMEILRENRIKYIPTGLKFGTITAIVGGKPFEITSARKDIRADGRHAEVEYTDSFEIDAGRRDFTFNALYLDFSGNVFDYFDGLTDLKKGIVRFIGDPEKRIQEDYLRILRFFRFYCYYGSVLDNEGLKYSIKYKDKLKNLSGERIKAEMFKILKADYPLGALDKMKLTGILTSITEIENFDFIYLEIFYSIKKYLNSKVSIELAVSLFLKDLSELDILKSRWKLSNQENKTIYTLLKNREHDLYTKKYLKELLFLGNSRHITIELTIANSIVNDETSIDVINDKIKFILGEDIPKFPITGLDLETLKNLPKKDYGKMLVVLKKMFMDSHFSMNKDELLANIDHL